MTEEYRDLLFTIEGRVATITLNRPEAYNAISDPMRESLRAALDRLRREDGVYIVIFTGAGKAFCAGGDVKLMRRRIEENISYRDRLASYRENVAGMVKEIRAIRQITVAQVNGAAYGAGCSIAMLCDIRVAAAEAKFGLPFGRRGLVPDWGALYFLPRLVGASQAIALTATGRGVEAARARELGLVNEVVPAADLPGFVKAYCQDILLSSPLSLLESKAAIYEAMSAELDTALEREGRLQSACFRSDDHREGVDAFLEKRPPSFTGK
ncbi:MAG: enoyl-CoA hydratase/isomerase family protein [Peptococcaceae bacterium]|jgi:2-(1,2-epoxy-1,2-dihydrophenyl)acetyl-CoA isomerase|nr:enoyl-CoA hydratase/isomerase family protein [Peptococcaceae bacterium]